MADFEIGDNVTWHEYSDLFGTVTHVYGGFATGVMEHRQGLPYLIERYRFEAVNLRLNK